MAIVVNIPHFPAFYQRTLVFGAAVLGLHANLMVLFQLFDIDW